MHTFAKLFICFQSNSSLFVTCSLFAMDHKLGGFIVLKDHINMCALSNKPFFMPLCPPSKNHIFPQSFKPNRKLYQTF